MLSLEAGRGIRQQHRRCQDLFLKKMKTGLMSCEVDSVPRGIVSHQRKETIQKQHIVRSVLTHQQYFHGRLFLAACYLAALAGHEVTSDLGPPTCDLLSETFMQHTSTPAFTSSLYLPPQLFFHPLFPGSRFVPVGRYCIMAES